MKINDFLIDENKTMIEAMEQLDRVARKVLFVTKEECFIATVTDGDIRRWILKKGSLEAKIKELANYNPQFLMENQKRTAKSFMRANSIEALPIVNKKKEIKSIIFTSNEVIESKKDLNIPVVIMAGGLGTRLYPYTKILPKPLIPVGEIPISEHIINRFFSNGCKEFYLILNHKKNMIKAYFNDLKKDYQLNYIEEVIPLGTGGGLSLLKGKINSTFILSNCDILIDEDYQKILTFHKKQDNFITMICSMKRIRIPYGVVEINETGEIEQMKEKPEISVFVNTGMYIVDGKVIEEIEENHAMSFPDIIDFYRKKGRKIGIFPIGEKNWLDMGQLDELESMRIRLETNE